jgi:RHS repeat-associated protein
MRGRPQKAPFGEPIRVSGSLAAQNPFRFSTKFTDDESGLVYYGYRYYNTSTGRWISRDPVGEGGGLNVYGLAANNPANFVDSLGCEVIGKPDVATCTIEVDPIVKTRFTPWQSEQSPYLTGLKSCFQCSLVAIQFNIWRLRQSASVL